MTDGLECSVCSAKSTDDNLDDFHKLLWADRPEVDASDLPGWLVDD